MKLYFNQNDIDYDVTNKEPYSQLLETNSLEFTLESERLLVRPFLLIGDMKLELTLGSSDEKPYKFISKTGKHFINNVGVAKIELIDENDIDFSILGKLNILSGKLTTERLKTMLEYICKTDVKLLHCCFSKSFIAGSGDNFEYTDLHHKLMMTEQTLSFLWESRHKFKNQPCKRVKVVEVVKKYQPRDLIDERTYSWLLSNMNELQFTVDPAATLINSYGKSLTSKNIATSTIIDVTDIFENQVIFSFLISVKKFIDIVEDKNHYGYSNSKKKSEHVDIIPFIQNFISDKDTIRVKLVKRIRLLVNNCIKFVSTTLSKTYVHNIRPKITQYVSKHNHYMSMYKLMDKWWNISASKELEYKSVYDCLYSMRSMDKIYEIFVLLQILESFQINKLSTTSADFFDFKSFPSLNTKKKIVKKPYEVFNYYKLTNESNIVELFVEPVIYPYRTNIAEGELFIVDKPPSEKDAKDLYKSKCIKTPDYVLKISNKGSANTHVFILDAKYSKFETVLNTIIETSYNKGRTKLKRGLIDKYINSIRIYDSKKIRMTDGIFATYVSGKPINREQTIHGISNDFGIWGDIPITPFMDLIEFSPQTDSLDNEPITFIENLLKYVNTNR